MTSEFLGVGRGRQDVREGGCGEVGNGEGGGELDVGDVGEGIRKEDGGSLTNVDWQHYTCIAKKNMI